MRLCRIAREPAPMMHRESGSYFHFLLRGWLTGSIYHSADGLSVMSPQAKLQRDLREMVQIQFAHVQGFEE